VIPSPEEPSHEQKDNGGWKLTLYGLMALQALSIAAFCLERLMQIRIPLPFGIGYPLAAGVGLVGTLLWCSESAIVRPHFTRLAIRSILMALLLWVGCFIVMPFRQPDKSAERIADATRAFHELVAEQKLPSPASEPEISRGGQHGEFVSIRYKDASGQELRLLASITYERRWQFQNPVNQQKITTPARY
jgi:hypothetical protein